MDESRIEKSTILKEEDLYLSEVRTSPFEKYPIFTGIASIAFSSIKEELSNSTSDVNWVLSWKDE